MIHAPGAALLIVDTQVDFCPGGALAVPQGDEVVRPLNGYIELFRNAGLPVIASRDWHPEKTMHFQGRGGIWPRHCVQDTPGAAFHRDLALPPSTIVVSKGMDPVSDGYSVFEASSGDGTRFEDLCRGRGIEILYVGGLATDYCVKQSVLDACARGFGVVLLVDAVRGVNVKAHDDERAIHEMNEHGAEILAREGVEARVFARAAVG